MGVYYADIYWKFAAVFMYPFFSCCCGILWLSLLYICNVSYWLLLGSLIKPDSILPYASGSAVVFFLTVSSYSSSHWASDKRGQASQWAKREVKNRYLIITRRTKALVASNVKVPPSGTTVVPSVSQYTLQGSDFFWFFKFFEGSLTVQDSLKILKQSQVLEITELSVREQILKEIVVFIIMLLFFMFILLGFTTLSSNQNISSGAFGVTTESCNHCGNAPGNTTKIVEGNRRKKPKCLPTNFCELNLAWELTPITP